MGIFNALKDKLAKQIDSYAAKLNASSAAEFEGLSDKEIQEKLERGDD